MSDQQLFRKVSSDNITWDVLRDVLRLLYIVLDSKQLEQKLLAQNIALHQDWDLYMAVQCQNFHYFQLTERQKLVLNPAEEQEESEQALLGRSRGRRGTQGEEKGKQRFSTSFLIIASSLVAILQTQTVTKTVFC